MKKYEWKIDGFAKGIDANVAARELKRIEKEYGCLTPEIILEASKPAKALFHSLFIWDDAQAARLYRLTQARKILNNIQIIIISDGESRVIPVYEVIQSQDSRVYKHIQSFTPEDVEQVKARTIMELNILKKKLSVYKEFYEVVNVLEQTTKMIENI